MLAVTDITAWRPDRVARVIYVDSGPLGEGGVINDELPAENGEIPLPDWSPFDKEDLVDLDADRRYGVPVTVIACEFSSAMLKQLMEQDHPAVRVGWSSGIRVEDPGDHERDRREHRC